MSTFQELFSTSSLDVIVPNTSICFPDRQADADQWLTDLLTPAVERKLAFFDEQLEYYLIIQLNHLDSPRKPPPQLLAFLSHLQISFDATYISSVPVPRDPESSRNITTISSPPVTTSSLLTQSSKPRQPPSIFPPATPHPVPSTAESDRKYVPSEGTPLTAGFWGDNASEEFQLLWSESNNSWIAVYKLVVGVSFVRMNFMDPLLCLTVSATLREKSVPLTGPRQRLAELIDDAGGLDFGPSSPMTPQNRKGDGTDDDELSGLEEVNLLGGLSSAPTFKAEGINLPSTRLGPATRHDAFFLRPVSPELSSPSTPTQAVRSAVPTLRKSFLKTLKTVSGFRVRMRTVFVPYVLLPEYHVNTKREQIESFSDSDSDDDGNELERERKEAGNDENTVVLCVEVENTGESGMGYTVESVDVHISGEGAKTTLIQWGCQENPNNEVFPLPIAKMEQYNLLYAVAFLESPEAGNFGGSNRKQTDMQRAVVIDINGRPYEGLGPNVKYPTSSFSSRWNCILDLSANINKELVDVPTDEPSMKGIVYRDALPTPASPFPGVTPTPRLGSNQPQTAQLQETRSASVASGSKRHTIGSFVPARVATLKSPVNYRSSTSMLNPALQQEKESYQSPSSSHGSGAFTPPSVIFQQSTLRVNTTYGPTSASPPPLAPPFDGEVMYSPPPLTPAYPAYPNSPAGPPTPFSQAPATSTQSSVGPSVEIRRGGGVRVFGGSAGVRDSTGTVTSGEGEERSEGEPVVVSVGLLPLQKSSRREELNGGDQDTIYPNDKFTLDIFVFNQSSWMRRFEVSYLDGRTWRKKLSTSAGGPKEFGIMPLENRIRVGPLRPSTCQSVRMNFLALTPGVHTIDTLTLTDIETGYAVNLRSVMDIVVHETSED